MELFFARVVIGLLLGKKLAREHHVLQRRILREKVEVLEHQPEMQPLSANLALFLRGRVVRVKERLAVHQNFPLVGRRQEVEAAKKRRLAAAGRADDRDGLALL